MFEKDFYLKFIDAEMIPFIIQERIFKLNDASLNASLLKVKNLKPEIEKELGLSTNSRVKTNWLKRPGRTLNDFNETALESESFNVLSIAAENPDLSFEAFKALTEKANFQVIFKLLKNENYPHSLRHDLQSKVIKAKDKHLVTETHVKENEEFFLEIIKNNKVPVTFLNQLSNLNFFEKVKVEDFIKIFEQHFNVFNTFDENAFLFYISNKIIGYQVSPLEKHMVVEAFFKKFKKDNEVYFQALYEKVQSGKIPSISAVGAFVTRVQDSIKASMILASVKNFEDIENTCKEMQLDFYNNSFNGASKNSLLLKFLTVSFLTDTDFKNLCKQNLVLIRRLRYEELDVIAKFYADNPSRLGLFVRAFLGGNYFYEILKSNELADEIFNHYMVNDFINDNSDGKQTHIFKILHESNLLKTKYLKLFSPSLMMQIQDLSSSFNEKLFTYLNEEFASEDPQVYETFFVLFPTFEGSLESLVNVVKTV